MEEVWKDIDNYVGLYKVSNKGRIYSTYNGGRILKCRKKNNYPLVKLCKKGEKPLEIGVHRLVAMAFCEKPEHLKDVPYEELEVDHIIPIRNGGTNNVSNLKWCTRIENANNPLSIQNRRESHKGKVSWSKPVIQMNLDGVILNEYPSALEAERKTNSNNRHINECCRGIRNKCNGFLWKYK